MLNIIRYSLVASMLFVISGAAFADSIGKIKKLSGQVSIERPSGNVTPSLGDSVYQTDKIVTGNDGYIGLLFNDDSRLAAGPSSTLALDKFNFDPVTHAGAFDVSMQKGTLSVISGKLTQKQPGALKVKTPAAILAVRGTEFSVRIEDPATEAKE
ncbi:MAG TPA: FecR domain-containing protein [Methylotenera sp.]|nr:FecR domain-containing protein [Methylotenera sp.]